MATPTVKPRTTQPLATKPPVTNRPSRPGSPSIHNLLHELIAVTSAPPIYVGYFPTHPPQKVSSVTAPIGSVADEAISIIPPMRTYSAKPFLPSIVPTVQLEHEIPFKDSKSQHGFDSIPVITPTFTLDTTLSLCPQYKPQLFEGITVGPKHPQVIQYQTPADGMYHPEPSKASLSASELSALIRWDLIKDPERRRQPCESTKRGDEPVVVPVISSGAPAGVPGYEALTLKRKASGPITRKRNMFGEEAENPWKKPKLEEKERYVPFARSSVTDRLRDYFTTPVSQHVYEPRN